MQHLPVTAWIPIRFPLVDCEQRQAAYLQARDRLLVALPKALSLIDKSLQVESAALGRPPRGVHAWLKEQNIIVLGRMVEYLRIDLLVSMDVAGIRRQNEGRIIDQKMVRAFAAMFTSEALQIFLLLSELAEPGRLTTTKGIATARFGGSSSIPAKDAFLGLHTPETVELTWPTLSAIDFTAVIEWAARTSILKSSLAATRVERALAAYSQMIVLTSRRDGEVLFRAMQGLEAFYCDGIGDLRRQLSEKAAIWLGRWQDSKNIFGHLYDLRSKFIHGSGKLEYAVSRSDAWVEDEGSMRTFYEGVTFSSRLLIATLQEFVRRGTTEVRWSYSYEANA